MARFCEQCGSELQPNENFCSSCGAKVIRDEPQPTYTTLKPSPPPQSTHVESTSTTAESQSPPVENNMGKFIVLIGILLLIFVVGYFASKPNTTPKPYNISWTENNQPPNYQGVREHGYACGIYSIGLQKSVYSNYETHTAYGTYYIVRVILENQTSNPVSINYWDIVLMDDRDKEYTANETAGATYRIANNFYNVNELQPNQPVFYCLVFDIPDSVTIKSLRFKSYKASFNVDFRVSTY